MGLRCINNNVYEVATYSFSVPRIVIIGKKVTLFFMLFFVYLFVCLFVFVVPDSSGTSFVKDSNFRIHQQKQRWVSSLLYRGFGEK